MMRNPIKVMLLLAALVAVAAILPAAGAAQPAIGEGQVLVEYFHDPNCQHCQIAKPVVEEVLASYGDDVVLVTQLLVTPQDFSAMFALGIYDTPALVLDHQVTLVYGIDFGDDVNELRAVLHSAVDALLARESPLAIQRVVEPATVVSGGTVNVTVRLENQGNVTLDNVSAADPPMEGTTVVSGAAGWAGVLPAGGNATYSYTMRVDLAEGSYAVPAPNVTYLERNITRVARGFNTTFLVTPQLSPLIAFGTGFFAGFNPCLLAILAFIASVSIAASGRRRDVVVLVVVFSLGIFVTYLLSGLGLLYVVEGAPALQAAITAVLVAAIGFLGAWHLADTYYIMRSDNTSFYTPKSLARLLKNVTKARNLPIVFALGALFSLIKAPCVGAVYFAILDLIIKQGNLGLGLPYLALYNLGVVLPVIALGLGIALGLPPEKVEAFRLRRRALSRFVTGVTLMLVALVLAFPTEWPTALLGSLGFGLAFPPEVVSAVGRRRWANAVFIAGLGLLTLAVAWAVLA